MYTTDDLKQLMARLRDPQGGCPWDLEQDFKSIAPSTIEEAYEVADTIEREDFQHLPEELGDLLFQVIFYSQLATEQGRFSFDEVVDGIVAKLLRRHPHVFPSGSLSDTHSAELESSQVATSWEAIKAEERQRKGQKGLLDDVPKGLPALARAQKLQNRLARNGWDWPKLEPMLEKWEEEKNELLQALNDEKLSKVEPGSSSEVSEELGDVLFMTVNIARFLGLDAEACLRASSLKFERRIGFVEQTLANDNKKLADQEDELLESLWQQAKAREKAGDL